MSRILDALHRASEEQGGSAAANGAGEAALPELLRALRPQSPGASATVRFAPLRYRANPEHLLVTDGAERTAQAESFRMLRFRLEVWRGREPRKSVLVASSIPREGKTMVAVNLARTLGLTGARVLLIDADLRKGGIHELLDFPPQAGLADVLRGGPAWTEACREIPALSFFYLPAGRLPGNPAELLRGPRLRQVLQETEGAFDWVILDSPPLVPFADARYLATLAHGALLVARARYTPIPELRKSLRALESFPLVGLVMNDGDVATASRYYTPYAAALALPPDHQEAAGA